MESTIISNLKFGSLKKAEDTSTFLRYVKIGCEQYQLSENERYKSKMLAKAANYASVSNN